MSEDQDGAVTVVGWIWLRPDGGEDAYRRYLEASKRFLEPAFGESYETTSYRRAMTVGGELDPDIVAINRFPSEARFMAAVSDPDYPSELLLDAVTRVEVQLMREAL